MQIECPKCSRVHHEPFFYCPNCGKRVIEVRPSPEADFVVEFFAGNWRRKFVPRQQGQIITQLKDVTYTTGGLLISVATGATYTVERTKLYRQMQTSKQVLELD